ncbi:MAG: 50S ribosomal protein L3 [Myxococcota bacterium]
MNSHPGIIGTKLGMTQVFVDAGHLVPCTVIQAGCRVVGKRTQEKDGYDAVVLGLGTRKDKHLSKAVKTAYAKREQTAPMHTRELRGTAEYVASFELGQELKVQDIFEEGQLVDVQARSKGKGFAGVMKRHNFKGAKASHGAHEWKRHGGSIGMATTPGRVWPGKKMAGQQGHATTSVLSQKIVKIDAEKQLILVAGGVPGPRSGVVRVQGAVKKLGGKKQGE